MTSMDCLIAPDNVVGLIDMFVEQLNLTELGFTKTQIKKEGCPPYHAKDLLKLYYYGYINRIRSSRKLAAECTRNVEVWWLIHQLTPAYHTIANFRKDNAAAFKKVFGLFVSFLKGEDMLAAEVIAVDGTKIRAQNSKRRNFNETGIAKHIQYIDNKTQEYIKQLDECDALEDKEESALKKQVVAEKIKTLAQRKDKYEQLDKALANSGDKQVSLTDAESRSMRIKDDLTTVCYNVQTAADSKYSLIVEFDTINEGDQGQLSVMGIKTKEALEAEEIILLADKGYHAGKQLQACEDKNITTIVAYPDRSGRAKQIDPMYQADKFSYDATKDCYTCPQGAGLTTTGTWHEKKRSGREGYLMKKYSTPQCGSCPANHLCTSSKQGRVIERTFYQAVIDANNKRVDAQWGLYKKRQEIIEHPYGTIKRSWGYSYTLLKSIKKVNGEMAIVFTMYNFRRAITLLGVTEMLNKLKKWKPASFLQHTGLLRALYSIRVIKNTRAA